MRSPSSAPFENGLLGSTASTPTFKSLLQKCCIISDMSVDFPAPGGPVIPIRKARCFGFNNSLYFKLLGPSSSISLKRRAKDLKSDLFLFEMRDPILSATKNLLFLRKLLI